MGNARLFEFFTDGRKTKTRVKRNRVRLRVQAHDSTRQRRCDRQEGAEYRSADSASSPRFHDRHASDVTIRFEPPGSDGITGGIGCEHMMRGCVRLVPLEFFGNVLFFYENRDAHCA